MFYDTDNRQIVEPHRLQFVCEKFENHISRTKRSAVNYTIRIH